MNTQSAQQPQDFFNMINTPDAPEIMIACVANLFSRQMHFKLAGDMEQGHTHPFDHLTLLAKGRLLVTVEGHTSVFAAPNMIYIKADKTHSLEALTDDTVAYCIHALRDGNGVGDILDPAMVPAGVNPLEFTKPLVYADYPPNTVTTHIYDHTK